ncbi:copper resistance D family protein [Aquibacillus salsiterrae]|uniref:CopD family protein n=1 Tax=Aquibacillus salsiterrae TaxID=2950439 RepID=A0A9X3WD68_9BACI|nr:CopD family protein [Aquibacillus salsiterrae]MDC3417695.1 CopD family protein [Aquibacillus salsiterrae]
MINQFVVATEIILYICFALLMGSLVLQAIPKTSKPFIYFPNNTRIAVVILIPVLSFFPLLEIGTILGGDVGLFVALKSVILTFEIGKAWMFTTLTSLVLLLYLLFNDLEKKPSAVWNAFILTSFLIFSAGYAGHASSITKWVGFLSHSFHFLAVVVWAGVVLIVAWFSKDATNWSKFLKIFSPLALICMFILIIAGLITMAIDINSYDDPNASIVDEYKNGLVVNYGLTLLLKHIIFIPLLVFAFINSIVLRNRLNENASYLPIKWIRAESIFILLVLIVTAFLELDYPPHQVDLLVKSTGYSPLLQAINSGQPPLPIKVDLVFEIKQYLLLLCSLIAAWLMVYSARKKESPLVSIVFGVVFIVTSFIAIVSAVQ